MKTVFTDQKDERFLKLVEELDYGYYKLIGDELKKYEQYNEFNDPHFVILLLESEQAIACASYRTCGNDSVEFKRVYVKKEYRKRGIAFCLIRKLEEKVIENGFRDSYIVTGKNNFAAIGLYEKLDYEKIAKFGQFKDDETVICMKKCFR